RTGSGGARVVPRARAPRRGARTGARRGMRSRADSARLVTLGCLVALLLVLSVEIFGIRDLVLGGRAVLWGMCIVPLALFLPGLLRGAWRSYQWLCFVVCVYFFVIVERLFRPTSSALTWVSLVL